MRHDDQVVVQRSMSFVVETNRFQMSDEQENDLAEWSSWEENKAAVIEC